MLCSQDLILKNSIPFDNLYLIIIIKISMFLHFLFSSVGLPNLLTTHTVTLSDTVILTFCCCDLVVAAAKNDCSFAYR